MRILSDVVTRQVVIDYFDEIKEQSNFLLSGVDIMSDVLLQLIYYFVRVSV